MVLPIVAISLDVTEARATSVGLGVASSRLVSPARCCWKAFWAATHLLPKGCPAFVMHLLTTLSLTLAQSSGTFPLHDSGASHVARKTPGSGRLWPVQLWPIHPDPKMDWPKLDWPKLDWPKLVKSGWPKRDWPKSVPSRHPGRRIQIATPVFLAEAFMTLPSTTPTYTRSLFLAKQERWNLDKRGSGLGQRSQIFHSGPGTPLLPSLFVHNIHDTLVLPLLNHHQDRCFLTTEHHHLIGGTPSRSKTDDPSTIMA